MRTDRPARTERGADKRRFPRRAKSLRFRFEHDGELHHAVTTSVSLSGAFLKSSHVPRPGTVLVLDERFNPDGVAIAIRGEVVWCIEQPSLERPDTGFGFRFLELFTKADPGLLEDFLRALDPSFNVATGGEIAYEERATGVHAVFRFPAAELDAPGMFATVQSSPGPEEALVVDLARELERLSREEARAGRGSVFDGADDGPTSDSAPFITAYPPVDPTRQPPPLPGGPSASGGNSPSGMSPPPLGPGDTRPRSRKRSVTGIFTALFGRGGGREDQPVQSEPTPALGMEDATGLLVHDPRRPRMLLSWGPKSVVARIESLGRQAATLWTNDAAPGSGESVILRPVGTPPGLQQLAIHAVVRSREDRQKGGLSWLSLDFLKVDEQGRAGRFQDYLRLVNGPGADER